MRESGKGSLGESLDLGKAAGSIGVLEAGMRVNTAGPNRMNSLRNIFRSETSCQDNRYMCSVHDTRADRPVMGETGGAQSAGGRIAGIENDRIPERRCEALCPCVRTWAGNGYSSYGMNARGQPAKACYLRIGDFSMKLNCAGVKVPNKGSRVSSRVKVSYEYGQEAVRQPGYDGSGLLVGEIVMNAGREFQGEADGVYPHG